MRFRRGFVCCSSYCLSVKTVQGASCPLDSVVIVSTHNSIFCHNNLQLQCCILSVTNGSLVLHLADTERTFYTTPNYVSRFILHAHNFSPRFIFTSLSTFHDTDLAIISSPHKSLPSPLFLLSIFCRANKPWRYQRPKKGKEMKCIKTGQRNLVTPSQRRQLAPSPRFPVSKLQ